MDDMTSVPNFSVSAIPTRFDGCLFRSRLEARWAVFLSCLGLKYEYEPEGYELADGTWYLPDFYVPDVGWLEVKGAEDDGKLAAFIRQGAGGRQPEGFLLRGLPNPFELCAYGPEEEAAITAYFEAAEDFPYWWTRCPDCGRWDITYEARGEYVGCPCPDKRDRFGKARAGDSVGIKTALIAARSARFEHGDAEWRRL